MTNKIVWGFSILAACAFGTHAFAAAEIASMPNAKASAGSVRLAQGDVGKRNKAQKSGPNRSNVSKKNGPLHQETQ